MLTHSQISELLKNNGLYGDIEMVHLGSIHGVYITIEWGDWRHEHGFCDHLMEQFGYVNTECQVTDSDGSDCYSAKHRYIAKECYEEWSAMAKIFAPKE